MRIAIAAVSIVVAFLVAPGAAADLHIRASPSAFEAPGPATRVKIYRTTRVARFAKKTIGMPCLLTPDVIVARRWNGPQCGYVENIIAPYRIGRLGRR
jgi:hypothetical protein